MTKTQIEAFKHVYYEGCLSCVPVIYDSADWINLLKVRWACKLDNICTLSLLYYLNITVHLLFIRIMIRHYFYKTNLIIVYN